MDLLPMIWPRVDRGTIAHLLDEVGGEARLHAVADLGKRELAALFDAAADNAPVTLDDLVPADTAPMTEVIHDGKNSLPLFSRFQKRFCRPAAASTELYGYNEQDMRLFTGPGYFVASCPPSSDLLIDYGRVPPEKPAGWPAILPNRARLGRFVYDGTHDLLRRVARGVSIGRALKGKRALDAWFVLVQRTSTARPAARTA
jgi:hypothetical protein